MAVRVIAVSDASGLGRVFSSFSFLRSFFFKQDSSYLC